MIFVHALAFLNLKIIKPDPRKHSLRATAHNLRNRLFISIWLGSNVFTEASLAMNLCKNQQNKIQTMVLLKIDNFPI